VAVSTASAVLIVWQNKGHVVDRPISCPDTAAAAVQKQAVEEALAEERKAAKAKDARHKLTVERLRRQIVELQVPGSLCLSYPVYSIKQQRHAFSLRGAFTFLESDCMAAYWLQCSWGLLRGRRMGLIKETA
jgi:hypothetical protein